MKYIVRDCEDAREVYGIIETDLPIEKVNQMIMDIKYIRPDDYSTEDLKEIFDYSAIEEIIDGTIYF